MESAVDVIIPTVHSFILEKEVHIAVAVSVSVNGCPWKMKAESWMRNIL